MKAIASLLLFATFFSTAPVRKTNLMIARKWRKNKTKKNLTPLNLDYDTEFAVSAADAGILEVQLGTLALTKATSSIVKQFAQTMIDDHTKANEELKALSERKNITLPTILSENTKKRLVIWRRNRVAISIKNISTSWSKIIEMLWICSRKPPTNARMLNLKMAAGKVSALEHHLSMAENVKEQVK